MTFENHSSSTLSLALYSTIQIPKNSQVRRHYITLLHKLYHKNVNNLLLSYFRSFTPQFNNGHNHDLTHNISGFPMTKRKYLVQCALYQFLKLVLEAPFVELKGTCIQSQFLFLMKTSIL